MSIYKFNRNLFFNKYKIKELIYKSSFSLVYKGININSDEPVSIKFEKKASKFNLLESEAYFLYILKGLGIPKIITYGISGPYNILIEELLGKSLNHIWYFKKIKNQKELLKNVCMIALQGLDRLEYIHSKDIIHRDIKPDNFLIGRKDPNTIYLIDFAFSRKFRSSRTGKHIQFKDIKREIGSLRYMSLNANKGFELSRRDDLESFGYLIIYLAKNSLPWIYLEKLKSEKRILNKEILKLKSSNGFIEWCKGLPKEFIDYIQYTRNLKFEQEPNYKYLKNLFISVLLINNDKIDYLFFWIPHKKNNKKECTPEKIINKSIKKNNSQKRLYKQIKNSLDKARSQEQNITLKYLQETRAKNNINFNSINEKMSIINNTFINKKLNVYKDFIISRYNTSFNNKEKKNIIYKKKTLNDCRNFFHIKKKSCEKINSRKINNCLNNYNPKFKIIITDLKNNLSFHEEKQINRKALKQIHFPNINILSLKKSKEETTYRALSDRLKLKIKAQRSFDNNLNIKNLNEKCFSNQIDINSIQNIKKIKTLNNNNNNHSSYLLNRNQDFENKKKNNSFIINNSFLFFKNIKIESPNKEFSNNNLNTNKFNKILFNKMRYDSDNLEYRKLFD